MKTNAEIINQKLSTSIIFLHPHCPSFDRYGFPFVLRMFVKDSSAPPTAAVHRRNNIIPKIFNQIKIVFSLCPSWFNNSPQPKLEPHRLQTTDYRLQLSFVSFVVKLFSPIRNSYVRKEFVLRWNNDILQSFSQQYSCFSNPFIPS
jgi:hypothetical protein